MKFFFDPPLFPVPGPGPHGTEGGDQVHPSVVDGHDKGNHRDAHREVPAGHEDARGKGASIYDVRTEEGGLAQKKM